jgi:predicted dehydrogenase
VFAQARQVLASGALGAARQVRSSMYLSRVFSTEQKREHAPSHSAGGVVSQAASDLLFLLVWYLGTPSTVRASWSQVYQDHEDELRAMMTLPGGAEIGFDSSWSLPGYPRAATVIELDGENGQLLASDDALEIELDAARGGYPTGHIRLGHEALTRAARFDLDGDAPYLQDASFLAWVTGGEPPPTRAELALRVPRLVEALYTSARAGGKETAVPS